MYKIEFENRTNIHYESNGTNIHYIIILIMNNTIRTYKSIEKLNSTNNSNFESCNPMKKFIIQYRFSI